MSLIRSTCRTFLLALWLVPAALVAFAGDAAATPARSLRFDQLSVEHGLAQESILAIAQDGDGFMWFGSQSGLSRFDGYRVTSYRNEVGNRRTLANNWARVLYVDRAGRLWIGTDSGLDRFEPATQTFTHFVPDEPAERGNGNRHLHALADDGNGHLWIATADGLQRFDMRTGAFKVWHHEHGVAGSLADDQVNALAFDATGRLWVGTASGLDSIAPGAATIEHHALAGAGARRNTVNALVVDASQTLWIGTLAGLARWDLAAGPGGRRLLGPAEGIPHDDVTVLFQDSDATLWVGTNDDGLYRWLPQEHRFANFRHRPADNHSLADNKVSSLFRDRVGTFWVGTWYAGVSRVDLGSGGFARIVKQAERPDTLSDNKVRAIVDDGAGKLWLGTNNGLNHYDPATGASRAFRHEPNNSNSLSDNMVNALALGRRGVVWAGGRAGVTSYDPSSGRFTRLSLANGDPDRDTIRGLLVDRADTLWISSRGGLHRLDQKTGEVKTFRHDPSDAASLADNVTRPILEDRAGRLWIGTFNGLDLMDRTTGKFLHFRHDPADPSSISHDEVHSLLEDRRGEIWVGTAVGLNKMERGPDGSVKFKRYTSADGLADDAVAAVMEDGDGNLWISSTTGLSRLAPLTGRWRNYSAGDGTIEGAYFDGSAMKAGDGTLYFGGFNGITAFNPRAISDNLIAPRAVITGFQVFNKPVAQVHPDLLKGPVEHTSEITLDAADSVFSLEFSALHYAAPQRNRFSYQLVGFDENWVATDATKRFATYTNLDPGKYTFRVKAANKDGVWSASGASLAIVIRPPFWKTWWFRALVGMLVLGSGYGAYRFRMSGLRRQKERLEHQVRARTDELALANRALQDNDERLRLAKQRAEDATRQKSEFLANMSHEMRTPLAGVIGMLGFALRDARLHNATREQILRGQANAQSLLAIINDLLDFSKIEAGKLTIENIDFALAATLENVVSLFDEQAAAHSIDFDIELAPDLPNFVVGDPTRLRQVLVNLVGNAFKFTNRGWVSVRVECLPADPARPGINLIRFAVHDTGIGISAEALARLFQKFEQADSTTTRRYGGTGLGLAICRQLVELMGGRIEVVSKEGVGSCFSFVLPLADGVAPPLVPQVARAPHTHQLQVLCAEDFPTNQIIIRMMLEDLGHQVDIADNGLMALAACARKRYDLILMDGRMPELDGASATRMIRSGGSAQAPVKDSALMIIALTANASEEDRARYLGAGMDDFLSKPIDEGALHDRLSRAIDRQLERGIELVPMPARIPGVAELDAMFGVSNVAAPAAPQDAGRRNADLMARMRLAFADDLPGRRADLETAIGREDHGAAALLLHGIKGSAAYLDAAELHLLCGELEMAADQRQWQVLAAAMPRLRRLLDSFEGVAQ